MMSQIHLDTISISHAVTHSNIRFSDDLVGIEVAIKSGFTDTSLIKMNCFGGFCVHLENM